MSYKEAVEEAAEVSKPSATLDPKQNNTSMRRPQNCQDKASMNLRLEMRYIAMGSEIEYMKRHTVICRILGWWPQESILKWWISQKWKMKDSVDLRLCEKGFFNAIFTHTEDRDKVFEDGPYFHNSSGLHMRCWT